jgi:nicotinate-nucleotide--dimethylbenzimidazole phosphoribosyltransferase
MAGDHGVTEEGVSAYPQEVTGQMIGAFLNNMATINALAKNNNVKIFVTDAGTKHDFKDINVDNKNFFFQRKIRKGTNNFSKENAMTLQEAKQSILLGFDIASEQIKKYNLNLIATGDMGIGNTTSSSAIGCAILKENPEIMCGRGTGIDDKTLQTKINIVANALAKHNLFETKNPIEILSSVGGFEIGAIAGTILAAAHNEIPVVIDGVISTAGALIAFQLCNNCKDYMIAGHKSVEPAHTKMLEYLGLNPILDLNMRLGEGTGAVMAIPIIESAACVIREVATFEEAGVTDKE